MPDRRTYRFDEVRACEMCGDPTAKHKVLGQRLNQTQGFRPGKKSGITVSIKKCRNCKLVYSSPQPIPNNIQDHYGIPPEDYWHADYFKLDPDYFSGEIGLAKQFLDFRPGMRSLDVGAGIGKCMIALKNAGFDAWGVEPSKPYYERAISKMDIPADKLRLGMAEEMEYEKNSFDFITFGAVFEHLYHPAAFLNKAFTWLKPKGVIHIEVPSSKYLIAKLVNIFYRLTGTNYVSNLSPMHSPFHLYEFGYRSFQEFAGKNGYKIKYRQYFVGYSPLLPRIFRPFANAYMKWTNTGMQLTVWLTKE